MRVAITSLILSSALLAACSAAPSESEEENGQDTAEIAALPKPPASLQNFRTVRPGLYRGGHPDGAGLDYLKRIGVKRVVNLEVGDFIEAFPWDISGEVDGAKARGLTEYRYPMSAFEPALSSRFDREMNAIVALLKTATPQNPVYVHCKHGQDRTGLVIGLERVLDEGWAPQRAFDEMVRIGFHTQFLGLDEYFENKTGYRDP
jgi:protein tyrosine/serine phosphatase